MDPCRRGDHRRARIRTPRRHRGEGAGDQPLHADPEAAVLPDQRLQFFPVTAEEDKAVAEIGLVTELVLDNARQAVDAPAHVLRIPGHEDPPHRREAQHPLLRQASAVDSSAPARSAGMPPLNTQRRPLRVVIVRRRRRRRPRRDGGWTISSMKPGIQAAWRGHARLGDGASDGYATPTVRRADPTADLLYLSQLQPPAGRPGVGGGLCRRTRAVVAAWDGGGSATDPHQ